MGTGQTVLLLHGFPEYWFGWTKLMASLGVDLQLVVPDQRGYNLSEKPDGVEPYQVPHLVSDIIGLIDAVGEDEVVVVGHDWGGIVAWVVAALHPDRLSHLVIVNSPHPTVFARELANSPQQQMASSYVQFFLTAAADTALAANDFAALGDAVFTDDFTEAERAAYREAWGQPGALTAMLNWYRASFDPQGPGIMELPVIEVPTLVLWGLADTAILAGNLNGLDEHVTELEVQTFEDRTHWIAHEIPDELAAAIRPFIGAE
jgi:pimeloyl-ACP methyl ester carboxylesterase